MGMWRSGPRAQMARQRDGSELGVMAVGDGSLLAVYVNVCMALKQLAVNLLVWFVCPTQSHMTQLREYELVRLTLDHSQMMEALQKYPQSPVDVKQWAASAFGWDWRGRGEGGGGRGGEYYTYAILGEFALETVWLFVRRCFTAANHRAS
ncbi:unnamed protein product [Boreogadus saida]